MKKLEKLEYLRDTHLGTFLKTRKLEYTKV